MTYADFDATITLNDDQLAEVSLAVCSADAVAAVRQAVERMPGAGWIDVVAQSYPPTMPGWVVVYPVGRGVAPDAAEWRDLRCSVEAVAADALVAAGARFSQRCP